MRNTADGRGQGGFTLIELLVVILIIAVLAAIAIPFFVRQRVHAYESQARSVLRDAATSAESYSISSLGDYSGLDGDDGTLLEEYGYRSTTGVNITVAGDVSEFCVTATHTLLDVAERWRTSTYSSSAGFPTPSDVDLC